jgi:Domain of unknown function (DUF4145)
MDIHDWIGVQNLSSKSYFCGHCNSSVASEKGWYARGSNSSPIGYLYICHKCRKPTFMIGDKQTPGSLFGNVVKDISEPSVEELYEEARRCTSLNAYTAAVLCCRKLLMHIAVSKGAKAGETFIKYVEYLSNNNYVPPGAKDWVDHIRKKGNEANHEITIMGREDAEELIAFIEMLLKIIYEFPASIQKKMKTTTTP